MGPKGIFYLIAYQTQQAVIFHCRGLSEVAIVFQQRCTLSPPSRSGCSTRLRFGGNLSNTFSSDIRADSTGGLAYLYLFLQNSLLEGRPEALRRCAGPAGTLRATGVLIKPSGHEQRFKDFL